MMQVVSPETALLAQRTTLITYLRMKLDAEDWHGVQDAASDIREIEAKIAGHKAAARTQALPPQVGQALTITQADVAAAIRQNHPAVPADDGWTQDEAPISRVRAAPKGLRCVSCGLDSFWGIAGVYDITTDRLAFQCPGCKAWTPEPAA